MLHYVFGTRKGYQTVSIKLLTEKKIIEGVSLYQKKSNGNGIKAVPMAAGYNRKMDAHVVVVKKNVPIAELFFCGDSYDAILFSKHYDARRYKFNCLLKSYMSESNFL